MVDGRLIELSVENFRTLRKVSVPLGPLNGLSHVLVYAGEGVRQQLAICFHARPRGEPDGNGAGSTTGAGRRAGSPGGSGQPATGVRPDCEETVDVMWAQRGELDGLVMHPAVRRRVNDAVSAPGHAHFD